ncbi:hypothetical protein AOLI_G00157060 [Acnodon oligacanthus]
METLGYNVVLFPFLLFVLKVVNIRAECERPSIGGNRGLIYEPDKPPFLNGSTATFRCLPGYKTVDFRASKSIICINSQWTELKLQCQKRSCGSLPDIPNGKFLLDQGIEFGATAVAQCNMGYQLVGKKNRYCEHLGWSGRNPTCEAVKCLQPSMIENGEHEHVAYELYEYGQAVTYRCKRGFTLVGQATISCSIDGTFHPPPPQCLVVSCEKPNIPNGNRVEGRMPPYKYKSSLRYECKDGYKMNGPGTMVCEISGWVPPLVNCTVITCPTPPVIQNGQIIEQLQDIYTYGQAVTYSCTEGFKLIGASKRTCSGDETFQPSPPECQVITCPPPPGIENGRINEQHQDVYTYGQVVTYSCMEGFTLIGASKRTCSGDETFQPSPPRCQVITCPTPPVIQNGQINEKLQDIYTYGQPVTYSCTEGFKLIGASKRMCSGDETFQPSPPECQVITCPPPPGIENGRINEQHQDVYTYGQVVTYSCMEGFTLIGASERTCSGDETFQPSPPRCQGVMFHYGILVFILLVLLSLLATALVYLKKKKKQSNSHSLGIQYSKGEQSLK